jgi:Ca-activated chloride channel homolog
LSAIVNGPEDFSETLRLQQVAPRRYEARLPLPNQGKYQVIVQGSGNERTESVTGGFIVSYSAEYLRFRSNPIMLKEIQEATGGKILQIDSPSDDVFGERLPRSSSRPIFDWLLISLVILLPIDVAVRRVHIDWLLVRGLLFRSREKQNQPTTLGSLLETKQQTVAQFDAARTASTTHPQTDNASPAQPPTARTVHQRPAQSGTPKASSKKTGQPDTTLAKLLAIKRQQKDDGDNESTSETK